ncbi:transmembrane protein 71 [Hyperolius riggenbachi]|uniref:transmembrane protein 71 n=1 Tax=Hyperolius riggenbachi TaxID=752182 RepID=UPI0035A28193
MTNMFTMEREPAMSTPKKRRYSSFFKELARLPSILFGHYSRDRCDLLKLETPSSSFLTLNSSPCRHSPRLLSNGYYAFEEDSFDTDDQGNVSFSPTKCTVSYKENIVRIFRRRRRPHAQRALDLSSNGDQEDWRPPHEEDWRTPYGDDWRPPHGEDWRTPYGDDWRPPYGEDVGDCEPLDFPQTFSLYSGNTNRWTGNSMIQPSPIRIPRVIQPEVSDHTARAQLTCESPQDIDTVNTNLIPVPSHLSSEEVGGISEKATLFSTNIENACVDDGHGILVNNAETFLMTPQKTIQTCLIGSLEGVTETKLGNERVKSSVYTPVLYICISVILIFLCMRFWTSIFFPSLFILLLSFAFILFPVSRSSTAHMSLGRKIT